MVISDFNLPVENRHLEAIIQAYDLGSLMKKPTCYQSHTPSCNDLILTNRKHLFQLSNTFKTGPSDHHKLIRTILKSGGFKVAPTKKINRSYETFDVGQFQEILKIKLENLKSKLYGDFETVFLERTKKACSFKTFLRHDSNPFKTKNLRKQIIGRSKLRNNYNKDRNYENWSKYKHQRNLCLNLLRKTKKNFYKALDEKQVSDSKTFWKNVKPFFSNKGVNSSKITLVEKTEL